MVGVLGLTVRVRVIPRVTGCGWVWYRAGVRVRTFFIVETLTCPMAHTIVYLAWLVGIRTIRSHHGSALGGAG